jgi:hypothetical protein
MAEFPKGIRLFDPNPKAPSFVKGTIVITIPELLAYVNENPQLLSDYQGKAQLRLQLLEKKQGGLNLTVDTFKPNPANGVKEPLSDLPF